jgi:hypothetical protein
MFEIELPQVAKYFIFSSQKVEISRSICKNTFRTSQGNKVEQLNFNNSTTFFEEADLG